jgi:hypothetical protein
MSVLRPRNRLVNFRLSEDEFEKLKSSCEQFGARSISDFARGSVLGRLEHAPAPVNESEQRITNLDCKVEALETRVGQLLRLIEVTGTSDLMETSEFAPQTASQAATGR